MNGTVISAAERRQILHNILAVEVGQGNRVAWIGTYEAHIWRMPAQVNHILHLILTLFTFGLWAIVWFLAAVTQPKAVLIGVAVDEAGQPFTFTPAPPVS